VANTGIARRGGAGFVVVLLLILMALARAQLAPTQDQVTAQRIIIKEWPALQDACTVPTVQRPPMGSCTRGAAMANDFLSNSRRRH